MGATPAEIAGTGFGDPQPETAFDDDPQGDRKTAKTNCGN